MGAGESTEHPTASNSTQDQGENRSTGPTEVTPQRGRLPPVEKIVENNQRDKIPP